MKHRRLLIGGAAATGLLAGIAGALRGLRPTADAAAPPPTVDIWQLRFARPGGGEVALAALRNRPLLLNFWATWCPPCVAELPLLDDFRRRQLAFGWETVGLAADTAEAVRKFLLSHAVTYPVAIAGWDGIDLSRRLGNPNGALPYSVLFAGDGRIVDRKTGALGQADLDRWAGARV